jgi:hypothetical protein
VGVIDQGDLQRMSPEERRHLAQLLAAFDEPHILRDQRFQRRRRLSLMFFMGGCVILAAWIAVLAITLPIDYKASHWRGAWVGFDMGLLAAFAATAWAAWRERQVLIICLAVTGTLLLCDAWFDLILDLGSSDVWVSLATAVFAELPLAFMMFTAARRLVRMSVGVVMALEGIEGPVPPLWKIPLFAEGLVGTLPARYRQGEKARARKEAVS